MIFPFLFGLFIGSVVTFAAIYGRIEAEKDRWLKDAMRRLQEANDFNVALMGNLPGKRRAKL